jgi:hypothetical protein
LRGASATKQSIHFLGKLLDCFAALAMTAQCPSRSPRRAHTGFRSSGWPIRIRAPSRTLSQNSK